MCCLYTLWIWITKKKRLNFKRVTWIEISSCFKEISLKEIFHLYLIIHTKTDAADCWIWLEIQQIVVCVFIWPVAKIEKLRLLVLYGSLWWICVHLIFKAFFFSKKRIYFAFTTVCFQFSPFNAITGFLKSFWRLIGHVNLPFVCNYSAI